MEKFDLISGMPEQLYFFNDNILKKINKKGNYQLYTEEDNLGTIKNKETMMEVQINNDICSFDSWIKEKIFDKIIKNSEINKINFIYENSLLGYTKGSEEIKIQANGSDVLFEKSYLAERVLPEVNGRDALFEKFYLAERVLEWRKVFNSDLIKKCSFELNSDNEKISITEIKKDNIFEVTDFIIKTVNDKFEFHFHDNEIKKEGELKYGEAIFLEYLFKKEHKGVFMEEIREKVENFKNNIIENTDYLGYVLKEFKNEESENVLNGLKIWNIFDECISIDEISVETLENALITAKEFPKCSIFSWIPNDFPFSIYNKDEKNELAIFLYENENISKMAKIYNIFKNEPNFSYFKNCSIEMQSSNGVLKIPVDKNNMIYKAKTENFGNENMIKEAKAEMGIIENDCESKTKKTVKMR